MLKQYVWRGSTWQFEEGHQPADAVEASEAATGKPTEKEAKAPTNKARSMAKNKAR